MRGAWLAMLGACGAPSFCPATERVDGTGCVAPMAVLAIDGDSGDWDVLPPPTGCEICTPGAVARVRGARTPDDRLALLLEVQGTAPMDAQHSYRITLSPVSGPLYYISVRARAGLAAQLDLTELPITGLPVEQGFGTVLEIAVPIAALPFAGGASVTAGLETFTTLGWVADLYSTRTSTVCWDPTSPVCAAD